MVSGTPTRSSGLRPWFTLAAFVIVVLGIGTAIGLLNVPGPWYDALDKPFFNPPNWVFAPVWSVIYILIAIAGWRVFERAPRSLPMGLWVVQMLLNWAWSPIFFGAENLSAALLVIVVMLATIVGFITTSPRVDRWAPWLFAPYAVWVTFATLLNLSLLILN